MVLGSNEVESDHQNIISNHFLFLFAADVLLLLAF